MKAARPPLSDLTDLAALRARGAPHVDAAGWHYIETLAERMQGQSEPAQQLLQIQLHKALARMQERMGRAAGKAFGAPAHAAPSPMAQLVQDMAKRHAPQQPGQGSGSLAAWRAESPDILQFRQQLSKLRVQKQVRQAIAQAPQNAGPINSHMLVLRSLGLMRNISPDYLNRFMVHVDTLLCLDEADKSKPPTKKAGAKSPR